MKIHLVFSHLPKQEKKKVEKIENRKNKKFKFKFHNLFLSTLKKHDGEYGKGKEGKTCGCVSDGTVEIHTLSFPFLFLFYFIVINNIHLFIMF